MSRVNPERLFFYGYFVLQELAVLGFDASRYFDSKSYTHLSLTGAGVRLPMVPLLFTIFPTDPVRVVAQVVLAAVAWWVLADQASRLVDHRLISLALRVALLGIGLVGPVANWNTTILSESTALSLTALLIAMWLRFVRTPTAASAAVALFVTLAWTLVRQTDVFFGLGLTAAGLVTLARGWTVRPVRIAVAGGLVAISVIGLLESRHNQTVARTNLTVIVVNRLLPNPHERAWFARRGTPISPQVRYAVLHREAPPRNFARWIDSHGESAYLRFVVTHPRYTFVGPAFSLAPYQPAGLSSILSPDAEYGDYRHVIPSFAESLLFEEGRLRELLILATIAFVLLLASLRRAGFDSRFVVPLIPVALALPEGYFIWVTAPGEFSRLGMITAVSLRVGLWIVAAVALDRLVAVRWAQSNIADPATGF